MVGSFLRPLQPSDLIYISGSPNQIIYCLLPFLLVQQPSAATVSSEHLLTHQIQQHQGLQQQQQQQSQQQQQQQLLIENFPTPLATYDEGQMLCTHSPISYNVSLKGGTDSGNFTDLGGVKTMDLCILLCCEIA